MNALRPMASAAFFDPVEVNPMNPRANSSRLATCRALSLLSPCWNSWWSTRLPAKGRGIIAWLIFESDTGMNPGVSLRCWTGVVVAADMQSGRGLPHSKSWRTFLPQSASKSLGLNSFRALSMNWMATAARSRPIMRVAMFMAIGFKSLVDFAATRRIT